MTSPQNPAPTTDAERFVADAERITNTVALSDALALFDDDCVAEWVFDGVAQRLQGIDEISRAMDTMFGVNRELRIAGRKTLVCADATTIVNTWQGGFDGDNRQFGTEVWTLRDGRVVRHRMDISLRLRAVDSPGGQLRMLLTAPRTALAWRKHQLRVARAQRAATARA